MTAKNQSRLAIAVLAVGLAGGLGWFWWLCCRSTKIDFLTKSGSAEWILYPKPPDGLAETHGQLSTEFRRRFVLDRVPAQAILAVRSLKRCAITINGKAGTGSRLVANWRQPLELEVSSMLQAGTNELSAVVFNSNGPPALWLSFKAGGQRLDSDRDWDCSEAGAVWRKARLASEPMALQKGNRLFGGENTLDSAIRRWRALLVFVVLSGGVIGTGAWWLKRRGGISSQPAAPVLSPRLAAWALAGVAILWTALFLHNLGLLPNTVGFDSLDHLAYIDFIRTNWALPLPSDGMEMYHAPLYYLLCNVVLAPFFAGAFSDTVIYAMRILGLLIGISNCVFIFLSCRLLFPWRAGAQLFGLVLAACLPAHLYLCHYITNEPLVAALVSGAIYFCLRIVTGKVVSWRLSAAAGLCLGGALLTKVTALLAVPFVVGALAHWLLITRPRDFRAWTATLGVLAVSSLAVAGWHYARMWIYCGTPIINIPGTGPGSQLWADDGFRTSAYYARFGECLVRPAYSVFSSFGDGIYSTLWGDALYGGQASVAFRPPWNYDLMAIGALLALTPTLIILLGAGTAFWRFARRPEPAWSLLIGLGCATFAAVLYVSLKLPFYFNVKAFYCLIALLPVCAFGAVGWETLGRRVGKFQIMLAVALGVWAINAYACFWIPSGAAATSVTRGLFLLREHRFDDAVPFFEGVLRHDPRNVTARKMFAMGLSAQSQPEEARARIEPVLNDAPDDAEARLMVASILARQGQMEAAVHQATKALELAPDQADGYPSLCEWLSRLGRDQEAATIAREGLRLKPTSPELHYLLGLTLAKLGEQAEGAEQLRLACDFKPDETWAGTLAAVYARAGQFDQAIDAITKAIKLAETSGNQDLAATNRKLLELYQARRAFHQE